MADSPALQNATSATDAAFSQGLADLSAYQTSDYIGQKYQGMMSSADYQQWKAEQALNIASAREARAFEKQEADTAMQRKVADFTKAGFSPLAALEATQGASVASASAAQTASAGRSGGKGNPEGVMGALIGALLMFATKGMSAAASASSAAALEGVRQSHRMALESMRQDRMDDRAVDYALTTGARNYLTEYHRSKKH